MDKKTCLTYYHEYASRIQRLSTPSSLSLMELTLPRTQGGQAVPVTEWACIPIKDIKSQALRNYDVNATTAKEIANVLIRRGVSYRESCPTASSSQNVVLWQV
jgi:hypothetical protein